MFPGVPSTASPRIYPTLDKVHLIWTKQCVPIHHKLSLNVIREIASYIGDMSAPVRVHKNKVLLFDMSLRQWKLHCVLRDRIHVSKDSYSMWIEGDQVFVCGGQTPISSCTRYIDTYVIRRDGFVRRHLSMWNFRKQSGVVYDPHTSAVYVFGGLRNIKITDTKVRMCEMFDLTTAQWCALPDMIEARYQFNPCRDSSKTYLCGGWTDSVEVYDSRINAFSLLPYFVLSEQSACTAVIMSENLIVVSANFIRMWDIELKCVLLKKRHQEICPWSCCAPAVNEGVVYISDIRRPITCIGINLDTGDIESETRIALS